MEINETKSDNQHQIICKNCQKQIIYVSTITNFEIVSSNKSDKYIIITQRTDKTSSTIKIEREDDIFINNVQNVLPKSLTLRNQVQVVTITNADDRFCGYKEIECSKCNILLGRVYLSTNFVIDPILNEILLNTDCVFITNNRPEKMVKKQTTPNLILTPYKEKEIEVRSIAKGTVSDIKRKMPVHNDSFNLDSFNNPLMAKKLEELDFLKNKQDKEIDQFKLTITDLADVIQELDLRARTSLYEVDKLKEIVFKLTEKLDKFGN